MSSFRSGEFVSFTPDGKNLVRDNFQSIEINPIFGWPWEKVASFSPHDFVSEVVLSPDGKWVANTTWTETSDYTVWLWNIETQTLERKYTLEPVLGNPLEALAFSPDGKKLAIVRTDFTEVWEIATWQSRQLPGSQAITFSADGSKIAMGDNRNLDLYILNTATWQVEQLFEVNETSLLAGLAFSPDGAWLAANTRYGLVYVWNLETGQLQWVHHEANDDPPTGNYLSQSKVIFTPDGQSVITSVYTRDNYVSRVLILNTRDGSVIHSLTIGNDVRYIPSSLSLSPDGKLLAVGTSGEAMIFELSRID